MTGLRTAQASNAEESATPLSGSEDETTQPKDLNIMTEVLGSRSRYQKGYGALPRLKVVGGTRASLNNNNNRSRQEDQQEIASLKAKLAQQEVMFSQIIAQQQTMVAQLQLLNPAFQTSQLPTFPSGRTSSGDPSVSQNSS